MTPHRLFHAQRLALAGLLVMAGISAAAAQFPPAPGQNAKSGGFPPAGGAQDPAFPPPPGQGNAPAAQDSAFPPPPGQRAATPQNSPFPPPPRQRSAAQDPAFPPAGQGAAPGAASGFGPPPQGGFSAPAGGGFGAPAAGGFGAPPGGEQRPTGPQAVCMDFLPIRKAAEEGALKIRAAGERKAPREEVCGLFTKFTGVEARLIKFLVDHKTLCGIPPQAITAAQANHAKTMTIRKNVCSGGAAPSTGPTLSDALGGPIIADDNSAKQPGRGTFDTLTGNVLSR